VPNVRISPDVHAKLVSMKSGNDSINDVIIRLLGYWRDLHPARRPDELALTGDGRAAHGQT